MNDSASDAANTDGVRIQHDGRIAGAGWFGPPERPLAGWWTLPGRPSRDGVVIAPPLGYEYWSTHRSLRTLAETLAGAGWNVLRFDWDGTGDSAGEVSDPDRVAAWRASLAHAVAAMREAGVEHVALVGLRLGATVALFNAEALGIDDVVACAPVTGKRFVKELKMLGIVDPGKPGGLMYAGLMISPGTASDLEGMDPRKIFPRISRTLLVIRSGADSASWRESLLKNGRSVDVCECPQMHIMLDTPTEDATVPAEFIEAISTWLGPGRFRADGVDKCDLRATTDMSWRGGIVRETFACVDDLVAICCQPPNNDPDTVVVFLNSGSEPHIGPGRAWVEYARALASKGYACVRVDFSGWGESPDEGHAPGRPYDEHCVADTLRIVAALRKTHSRIVLAGLCAGAWVALKAAQLTRVEGVFALNPQLYWQPGDPVEALITDTHRRRTSERRREAHGARWKYWSLLDLLGIRPMAARWLIALRKSRTPVVLGFAEGDDGLIFLRDRCGRRLARERRSGYLVVEEVSGIDHQMYRLWRRGAVTEQMLRFLDALQQRRSAVEWNSRQPEMAISIRSNVAMPRHRL